MNANPSDLAAYGWSPFFQSQLTEAEIASGVPARVTVVHRDEIVVVPPGHRERRVLQRYDLGGETGQATVGDWVMLTEDGTAMTRLLERKSLFKRRAAGRENRVQLLAANVDTLLVVSSCNDDFNLARLERYLALANEAGVEPILLLTKGDLAEDPGTYAAAARGLDPQLLVLICDARNAEVEALLGPWLGNSQTIALMGSSGVGKSTLINTLTGGAEATAPIREDDAKGRHTTSHRSLHKLPSGAWLIDTPGMRELQLSDAKEGVEGVFEDIVALAAECRFTNCRHETEPGCAVLAAIEDGSLDPDRLERFRKLQREDEHNTRSIAERHAHFRTQGKLYKAIKRQKRGRPAEE